MRLTGSALLLRVYLGVFFVYLFAPLIVMSVATFNTSRFPTVAPWLGTTLKWFEAMWADEQMWSALFNSVEEWLAAADRALYRAKREGRNRVRLASSNPADDLQLHTRATDAP